MQHSRQLPLPVLGAAKRKVLHFFLPNFSFLFQSVWALFAENNISHSALIAVLYHFVQEAQHKKASVHQRLYALHAAGLYFLLVEIPGKHEASVW